MRQIYINITFFAIGWALGHYILTPWYNNHYAQNHNKNISKKIVKQEIEPLDLGLPESCTSYGANKIHEAAQNDTLR